jgi:hypothetical protein
VSLNLEQQITPDLGVFARAGIASGGVEPYEFSDIDRTWRQACHSPANNGDGLTTRSASPAWSTAFRMHTSLFQCRRSRHPGWRRTVAQSRTGKDCRNLLQLPDRKLARDPGLSVHRQIRPTTVTAVLFQ